MRDLTYPPVILTAKTLFKLVGMRFQMSGTENIPRRGGAVLAANHISYVDFIFDGLAAQPSGRLVRFMAKKESFEHPVSGPLMRSFHHISVDRENGEGSFRQAVDYARSGEIVGIFPEATISRSMEIKELKTGAVRIAAEAGVPLIPMVTWGTQLLKTKDHPSDLWGRGKTIALHVGEPLMVNGADPVAETERLHAAMSALLDKAITEYPIAPEGQWWAPARYGGLAPTPEEAARLDAEEKAARAARRSTPEA
ncbi:1-acyl-sn-glycerol-3-phosphate acyltransferase [Aeromicrobium phragmitis]|uniref:1-acyl-sn-glycerol-3-phosphate acyltransferase n=1 Tax=Aeromicrobium phragmitis TaxID=2478914 RepID=A0A3L8PMS7_9ACTN|nr:lysophospholipid acyltransferase family protein [Aeromicrobium phragmitis]RLV56544.1 1-acyl-sn-glycerol-3-phosphate acyltransferase [Aeromicrobium phragmitis]